MILDRQDAFVSTATPPVETLGGTASGVSEIRNLESAGALDGSKKVWLNIVGVAGSTSDTLTIILASDSAVGFATAKVTNYTTAAIAGTAMAATRIKVLLPEGVKAFSRIEWTHSSNNSITFKAFLSNS